MDTCAAKKLPSYDTLDPATRAAFLAQFDNPAFTDFFLEQMKILSEQQIAILKNDDVSAGEAMEAGNIYLAAKGMLNAYHNHSYRPRTESLRCFIDVALGAKHRMPRRFSRPKWASLEPENFHVQEEEMFRVAARTYGDLRAELKGKPTLDLFPDLSSTHYFPPENVGERIGRRAALGAIVGALVGAAISSSPAQNEDSGYTPSQEIKGSPSADWATVKKHAKTIGIGATIGAALGAAHAAGQFRGFNNLLDDQVNAKILERVFSGTALLCKDRAANQPMVKPASNLR